MWSAIASQRAYLAARSPVAKGAERGDGRGEAGEDGGVRGGHGLPQRGGHRALGVRPPRLVRHRDDVGTGKVVALEKERFVAVVGEGVGEAVAKVEPGGVPALAVALICAAC